MRKNIEFGGAQKEGAPKCGENNSGPDLILKISSTKELAYCSF